MLQRDADGTAITPARTRLADYRAPAWRVPAVELVFDLGIEHTEVEATLTLESASDAPQPLHLDGEGLQLLELRVDDRVLGAHEYRLHENGLDIPALPSRCTLRTRVRIHPAANTALEGLYLSGSREQGFLLTQCEAEGFRRITYFPDRPDVSSRYDVELRADAQRFPVLLAGGNPAGSGRLDDGRHYARFSDPHPKPSYLFALVAGRLERMQRSYTTADCRAVMLNLWAEPQSIGQCGWALDALERAMRWDEQTYGRNYDLEVFHVVATQDFNMGAMENKGLNIFNAKYLLADADTTTDEGFRAVEAVVAHEYFHNWSGNRVTCRDWFQLSLKEGLTVFRDQEFSADMVGTPSGRAVKRIEDVRALRQHQFSEDAGPMAHPVRPDYYVEISNFYTVTIYEKGAEVVRMYQTLLGRDGFRKGMDLYFARHDGQAVTCDDFRAAMADSSGRDLSQFERWYSQSGTPRLKVRGNYDAARQTYALTLSQSCKPGHTLPFHIPVAVGLLDAHGRDMPLHLEGTDSSRPGTTCVLELTRAKQTFTFNNVKARPTPSLLRNFSAPVVMEYDYTDRDLALLMAHDSDAFNRWEAGQRLAMQRLLNLIKKVQADDALTLDELFIDALRTTLNDQTLDPSFIEVVLTLPSELMLAEQCEVIDPQAIHAARNFMRKTISERLKADFIAVYEANLTPGKYSPDARSAGRRALKNLCLSYLSAWEDESTLQLAHAQLAEACNMTDRLAALMCLVNTGSRTARQPLNRFYRDFRNEALVVDKWFSLQAVATHTDVKAVRKLMTHPAFTLKNPNRARSLIFSFCNGNPSQFHAADGSGYAFWTEQVIALDRLNPQVAARLVRTLDHWKKYVPQLRKQMQASLQKVAAARGLSRDVQEVVLKTLG